MPSIISFIGQTTQTSTNSFSTIQTPSGTSPTASSPTDTLTLTSTDGTVTINGNSATDTIDFSVPSAPLAATYVTLTANATLPNERLLTGTANQIIITDNGAGSTVVLSTPQNIATSSSPTFSGLTLSSFSVAGIVHNDSSGILSSSLIVNSDIDTAAAIARSKIASGTANHVIINDSGGALSSEATLAVSRGGTNIASFTNGDMVYATGATTLSKLAIGASANVMTSDGNIPRWQGLFNAGIAPNNALYLTLATNATLTVERVLTQTAGQIILTDNGAGLTAVLTFANPITTLNVTDAGLSVKDNGDNTKILQFECSGITTSTTRTLTVPDASGTIALLTTVAPIGAQYVTLATDATLTAERVLTGTANQVVITDNGAGSTVVLSLPQSIATASSVTFGNVTDSALTAGRVVFAGAAGILSDDADLSFSVDTLTSTKLNVSGSSGNTLIVDTTTLVVDSTNNRVGIGTASPSTSLNITPDTANKALAITTPTYNPLTASTEFTDITFDLSASHVFSTGTLATQRAMRIIPSKYTMTGGIATLTKAVTLSIGGPADGDTGAGSVNLTNTYGLEIEARTVVTAAVTNAIALVVNAPSGAAGVNAAATFNGGSVGINTLNPLGYLDVQATTFSSAYNHVTNDGATRYSLGFWGSGALANLAASGGRNFLFDFGFTPISNTAFAAGNLLLTTTFGGGVNFTGNLQGFNSAVFLQTTAGTTTQLNSNVSSLTTSNVSTLTTARIYQSNATYGGSGTVTTAVNYDTVNTVSGSTVTDLIGFRFGLPTVSSGALTNVTAIDLLDQTETVTTLKIGIRQRGTNAHNRFNGDCSFAQDATPGAAVDVAGKLFITNVGLVTKYNNIVTVSNGVPSELATVDLTTQAAAIADTTIYTPAATGLFRISIFLQVTRAASTSSVLGGATGVIIKFNDGDGNVAQTNTAALATTAGAIAVTAAGNTTTTNLEGSMVIYARTGVAITYAIGYTSVGVTTMQYAAHLKVEAL